MFYTRLANLLSLLPMFLTLVTEFVDCQICKPGMTYHRDTHTCMAVIDVRKTQEHADNYCADVYSGGHLVYILDFKTNNFIAKFLLPDTEWYHIGLTDADRNGQYKWSNGQIANYTNFQVNHSPSNFKKYVFMSKTVWLEDYNRALKSICQTFPERDEFFFLNGSDFDNTTSATTALVKNVWKCGKVGMEDHHLELLYRNVDKTIITVHYVFGKEMSHVMYPSCNSSGVYVCRITDKLNINVISLEGILKVQCKATYCEEDDSNTNLHYSVYTGKTEGKFCVFVYSRPSSLTVYKKIERVSEKIHESKYNISFSYTDEISTRGEIYVRFYNVTSSDNGRYFISVWDSQQGYAQLFFNIAGPPQCPKSLISEAMSQDTVRLTWSPLTDKLSKQKFDIFRAIPTGDVVVATVSNQNAESISYNVTGLSANINYSFYLHVESDQVVTQCSHLTTSILIKGLSVDSQDGQSSKNNIVFYIVPIVAVVVLLVICVVIIVLVRKRKQNANNKTTFTDQKDFKYNCGSETTSAHQSSQRNNNSSNKAFDPVCSTEVAENIYNNVLENKAQQSAKVLKPARKSGSSVKLKDRVSMATGVNQAATLPLGKTLVTWDDEKEDVNVYENTRNNVSKEAQEHKDNEEDKTSPSRAEEIPSPELHGQEAKPKDVSRTVSPEGLVYVSVEINTSRKNPRIVVQKPKTVDKKQTQNKKPKEIVKEVKPSYEAVEYSSLDYLATSVAATEDGVGDLAVTDAKE
ncbi:lectin BRA-3 [Biomphalaria pfeifferi]|uniref:Lectin BRA-3 n=1 Tax=Biomphalaria pfeifferi TaxID=112525 RepID=A0AAD8BMQ4_BIOPF|nr:lectin BRA-3 [Biomphalaria pfeifferi]